MDTTPTLTPTGRRVGGPTADLVEAQRDDGALVTSIVLDPKFKDDDRLKKAIRLAEGFMRFPMVTGLADLDRYDADAGALSYVTGPSRSIAEIVKNHRDAAKPIGRRAALELCYLAGLIVSEAGETGGPRGVFSHGDLSPWRILVRPDGQVQIVGHGVPSPEVLRFHGGDRGETSVDSWRYAPPERVSGAPEDAHSDLFSLVLVAAEMILGHPVFDGSADAVRDALAKGDAPQRLSAHSRALGPKVAEIFAYALNFDPRNRYPSGEAFVDAVEAALRTEPDGETLAEVSARVHASKRGTSLQAVSDATAAIPLGRSIQPRGADAVRQAIAAAAADDDRWSSRGGRRGHRDEPARPDPPRAAESASADRPRTRAEAGPSPAPAVAGERPRTRAEATSPAPTTPDRPRTRAEADAPTPPRGAAPAAASPGAGDRPRTRADAAAPAGDRPRTRAEATSEPAPAAPAVGDRPRTRAEADTATPAPGDRPRTRAEAAGSAAPPAGERPRTRAEADAAAPSDDRPRRRLPTDGEEDAAPRRRPGAEAPPDGERPRRRGDTE